MLRPALIGITVLALGGASQAAAIGGSPNSYSAPTWVPDGTALTYHAYAPPPTPALQRVTLDGKISKLPVGGQSAVNSARVSARGELAFVAPGDRNTRGAVTVRDLSGRLRVLGRAFEFGGLGWSPDGGAIAFQASSGRLATLRAEGGGFREFPYAGADPAWSPDGTRIAFSRGVETFVLDIGTGVARAVGPTSGYSNGEYSAGAYPRAVWSPDSTRLALALFAGVQVVRADGSGREPLIRGASFPSWSPDGSELAYARNSDIVAAAAEGSSQRVVVASPMHETTPTWSPDGRWIAFTNYNVTPPGQAYQTGHTGDVFVVRPDGSERRSLTGGCGIGPETPLTWVCLVNGRFAVPLDDARSRMIKINPQYYPRAIRFPVFLTDGMRNVYGARVTVTQVSGPRVRVTSGTGKAPSLVTDTGGRAAFRFLLPRQHGIVKLRVVVAGTPRLLTLRW